VRQSGIGRVEQITIAPDEAGIARQFVRNYQRLRRILEAISSINRNFYDSDPERHSPDPKRGEYREG